MKSTSALKLATILCAALTTAVAGSEKWNFRESPQAVKDWTAMGEINSVENGLQLGPWTGLYVISGIKSNEVFGPGDQIKVAAQMEGITVTIPADETLDSGNDMRIQLDLNPQHCAAWDSDKPVVSLALYINGENNGVFAGILAKEGGQPQKNGELIAGDYLGDSSALGRLGVELHLDRKSATARIFQDGTLLKTLAAPLPPEITTILDGSLFLALYQANIGEGTGKVVVSEIELK